MPVLDRACFRNDSIPSNTRIACEEDVLCRDQYANNDGAHVVQLDRCEYMPTQLRNLV